MKTRILFYPLLAVFLCLPSVHAKQDQDVNVVNNPTVFVGNPVTIDNSELPVNIVDQPITTQQAKTPVNYQVQFFMSNGLINSGQELMFTVPSGLRYVIESISVWNFTTTCAFDLLPSIITTAGGTTSEFRLPTPDRLAHTLGFYTNSSTWPIKLYADPDTDVNVNAIRTDGSCNVTLRYAVSGYLEPVD